MHNLFSNDIFILFSNHDNNDDNNKTWFNNSKNEHYQKKKRIKWREKIIYHFFLLQHFLCLFKLQ